MTRSVCWSLLLLAASSGCIEGPDPGACRTATDCASGEACGADRLCAPLASLRDVTVRWTFEGQAPRAATPGRCVDVGRLAVGVDDGMGDGMAALPACVDAATSIARLPRAFSRIEVVAYAGPQSNDVLGRASGVLPDDSAPAVDVTLDLVLPR